MHGFFSPTGNDGGVLVMCDRGAHTVRFDMFLRIQVPSCTLDDTEEGIAAAECLMEVLGYTRDENSNKKNDHDNDETDKMDQQERHWWAFDPESDYARKTKELKADFHQKYDFLRATNFIFKRWLVTDLSSKKLEDFKVSHRLAVDTPILSNQQYETILFTQMNAGRLAAPAA